MKEKYKGIQFQIERSTISHDIKLIKNNSLGKARWLINYFIDSHLINLFIRSLICLFQIQVSNSTCLFYSKNLLSALMLTSKSNSNRSNANMFCKYSDLSKCDHSYIEARHLNIFFPDCQKFAIQISCLLSS